MKKVSLLIVIVVLAACKTLKTSQTLNGYKVLPPEAYTLKNAFTLSDTSILSPTCIYTCCSCAKDGSAGFLRFFRDGKVVVCDVYKFEGGQKVVSSTGGYYTLQGNQLRMEVPEFDGSFFRMWTERYIYTGTVNGDTIVFDKAQENGRGANDKTKFKVQVPGTPRCGYVKSEAKYALNYPDW